MASYIIHILHGLAMLPGLLLFLRFLYLMEEES